MHVEPDYKTWVSHVALSPHAMACLMMGVAPTSPEPTTDQRFGCPPTMPEEAWDIVDPPEWDQAYQRFFLPLRNAIDTSELACKSAGLIEIDDAIRFLTKVAKANGWDDELRGNRFYQMALARIPDEAETLRAEVEGLRRQFAAKEIEIAHLRQRRPYSTPLLEHLDLAIEEFYYDEPENHPTTAEITEWIVSNSQRKAHKVTKTGAAHIAAILTSSERRRGGRPRQKP